MNAYFQWILNGSILEYLFIIIYVINDRRSI